RACARRPAPFRAFRASTERLRRCGRSSSAGDATGSTVPETASTRACSRSGGRRSSTRRARKPGRASRTRTPSTRSAGGRRRPRRPPASLPVLGDPARVLYTRGLIPEARKTLDTISDLDPSFVNAKQLRLEMAIAGRDLDGAVTAYLALTPSEGDVLREAHRR